jgi:hypothetical protein
MLDCAVDFAESAAHAVLFFRNYFFQYLHLVFHEGKRERMTITNCVFSTFCVE